MGHTPVIRRFCSFRPQVLHPRDFLVVSHRLCPRLVLFLVLARHLWGLPKP